MVEIIDMLSFGLLTERLSSLTQSHLRSCSFKLVSCTYENCEAIVARKDLEGHISVLCEWRIVECGHCSEEHPKCLDEVQWFSNVHKFVSKIYGDD